MLLLLFFIITDISIHYVLNSDLFRSYVDLFSYINLGHSCKWDWYPYIKPFLYTVCIRSPHLSMSNSMDLHYSPKEIMVIRLPYRNPLHNRFISISNRCASPNTVTMRRTFTTFLHSWRDLEPSRQYTVLGADQRGPALPASDLNTNLYRPFCDVSEFSEDGWIHLSYELCRLTHNEVGWQLYEASNSDFI